MFTLFLAVAAQLPQADAPYFQQHVDYRIEATLDESRERLRGAARLVYHNRSPDRLTELYLHLHLNAFRPGSLWARTERRAEYDFASLRDPDFGFERLGTVTVDGRVATPEYPHAPDSTVVRIPVPSGVEAGAQVVLAFDWEARPSTLCRRQCRSGRSYDFAQWYPRIAPYDAGGWQEHPLYPQGEFYGEFGRYDVTLDLAADQVVGATGVPVEGDPGWEPVAGSPEPRLLRDAYGTPGPAAALGLLSARPADGRRRVRFLAEQVHHFAWSTSPDYRYEGGVHEETAIHVLYRPGDEPEWGGGQAVERTVLALAWLEDRFGEYRWPQLTNLHRLEGGGTEFPMLMMDGSASQGLIMHETAHQFAHGILANNEWREGWLDEGMASFLSAWFEEDRGARGVWDQALGTVSSWDRRGVPMPISSVAEDMPDFSTYNYLTYTRPSAVLYMLRGLIGTEAFSNGLRLYYREKALQHVTESDLRQAMEDASGVDLGWFFDVWIQGTGTVDYAVAGVDQESLTGGGWRTTVEITREGDAWVPVTLLVGDERRVLDRRERSQTVIIETRQRPDRVVLDPDRVILDTDRRNDRWTGSDALDSA